MGYKVIDPLLEDEANCVLPIIEKDNEGTTSWRDAKKALRQWYLDRARALRAPEQSHDDPLILDGLCVLSVPGSFSASH